MTFLFVIVGIAVIATVIILITGRAQPAMGISATGDYRPEFPDDPQFDVVVRGYRMDEVDAKIAELEQEIGTLRGIASPLGHAPGTGKTQ
jgi:hypothetical protein